MKSLVVCREVAVVEGKVSAAAEVDVVEGKVGVAVVEGKVSNVQSSSSSNGEEERHALFPSCDILRSVSWSSCELRRSVSFAVL